MFSKNQKVSGRQLQYLIVLDWIGKASLLLPRFTQNSTGRSFIMSLILGLLLTGLYLAIISWLSKQVQNDFYGYIHYRIGRGAATAVCLAYWLYVLMNTVYLVRLFMVLAGSFLLPEFPAGIFPVLLVGAGYYGARGGLEVRGRTAEVVYKPILVPLLIMLLVAAFSIRPEYLAPEAGAYDLQTLSHGLQIFIAFGGAGIFLFVIPRLNKKSDAGAALMKSLLTVGFGVLALFLVVIGVFGESGMRALPWPVITLMSSVEIPGGFIQRWDVIFAGLLLSSFFVAAVTGLFYMRLMAEELLPATQNGKLPYLEISAVLVLITAYWCGSYETAARIYVIVNGYILIPISVAFTCLLGLIEWFKRRREK